MLRAMYLPPQFQGDRAQACALMKANPFASLISVDDTGLPCVTHVPLHLQAHPPGVDQAAQLVLLGHVAKANPQWRHLQARPQALVTFLGPHAYMSPRVYPDLARVPTWNYLAVHCTVQATLIEEPADKDRLLKKLISDHEPAYAAQWQDMDPAYAQNLLAGIVAFELRVSGFQCAIKLNQHRPHARAAMKAIYSLGNENEPALARWMDVASMIKQPPTRLEN